jgi:hypothetical protein
MRKPQLLSFVLFALTPSVVGAAQKDGVPVVDPLDEPASIMDRRVSPVLIAQLQTTPPAEPLPPPDIDDPGPEARRTTETAPLPASSDTVTLQQSGADAAEKVLPREGGTRIEPDAPKPIASNEPLPEKVRAPDEALPAVTIRTEGELRVEEYRRNGQIYMVRFVPNEGLAYTYLDTDGDGRLEGEPGDRLQPVFYTIYEWE